MLEDLMFVKTSGAECWTAWQQLGAECSTPDFVFINIDKLINKFGPGYDIKLIRCCHDYDVKLIWCQQGNDIVSLAAICAAAVDIYCLVVPDLLCKCS